jgi:Ras-related protein Rab-1A
MTFFFQESFQNIRNWLNEIDKFGGSHVAKMLVGNKSDLKHKREVTYEMAQVYMLNYVICPYFIAK